MTVLQRVNEKGWATTEHMEVSDVYAKANNLLIVRGESQMLDGIFKNDFYGQQVIRKALERKARKKKK